jgi:hypothetical protein
MAWAITLAFCLVLVALAYLAVQGISRRAKVVAGAVVLAVFVLEVAAVLAYRDSTDGQTGLLWAAIPIGGLLALAALRLLDQTWHQIRQRSRRT